ncbi:MAG: RNA polymerase factor sigma-54 [Bacteroidales bacterium]|nr:RNA polymerase factor sigma-54 [Bacteroidales bacterium]
MSSQRLTQTQKLLQKLSPQQILIMKLLQIPTMELGTRIKEEIMQNPALEEGESHDYEDDINGENINENDDVDTFEDEQGDDDHYDPLDDFDDYLKDDDEDDAAYKYSVNNSSPDDKHYETPITNETTFQDTLMEQLGFRKLDEKKYKIGAYIIGNLDDAGYLSRPINGIADDLLFTQNLDVTEDEVRDVLGIIQDFDPAGVGASNLQECLMIQLRRINEENPSKDCDNAMVIIEKYFDEFTKKHYDKIVTRSEMSDEDFKRALNIILSLNPKPGGSSGTISQNNDYIIPDFTVINNGGELELQLNNRNTPELHVSKDFMSMLKEYSAGKDSPEKREAIAFIKNKIDSANWFIDAIKQRQNTLYVTMKAIMEYQREFFITGDEGKLKPMILKDISDMVGLDISTISRVANSKYVQTAYGTFPLKFFFSEGLVNDEGEEVSTREVKKIVRESVENEDKANPLNDDELTAILKEKGYTIARRTVAKYREQLGIPVARLRKVL